MKQSLCFSCVGSKWMINNIDKNKMLEKTPVSDKIK